MKIGIIFQNFNENRTGIDRYGFELINSLYKQNKNNRFLVIGEKKLNIPNKNFYNLLVKNPFKYYRTHLWYNYLPYKLKNIGIEVLHNVSQIPTFFGLSKNTIITIFDISIFTTNTHPFHRIILNKLFFKRTLNHSQKIISISEFTKKELIRYFNIPESKIKVIYLAADKKFKPLPKRMIKKVIKKNNLYFPYILYVGTLEPRKNIPNLLRAYSKIKDKIPPKLVITGKKGWKYKEIFETINNLKLENDVIFTGYVPEEDLPALYNGAELFVYPSYYEGFGLPPLEAMQCGCPVITSNTSSLPEVVGKAGIMVNPNNIGEIANAMFKVLNNKSLRRKMIKNGLKQAKKFSWEKTARETLKIYKEVYHHNLGKNDNKF